MAIVNVFDVNVLAIEYYFQFSVQAFCLQALMSSCYIIRNIGCQRFTKNRILSCDGREKEREKEIPSEYVFG